ncbi:MAG: hypothetical protein PHW62_03660 [Candidatus Ratteibacteria bacterium]|nr:hypothetical protein [Candidatus Ratteibacteria bacterium]
MDKTKKAFWLSVFLTGAGQFYLGERKKGWYFLIFSVSGILVACIGTILVTNIFLRWLSFPNYKIFLFLGFLLAAIGLALIIIPGYRSIKDITASNKIKK